MDASVMVVAFLASSVEMVEALTVVLAAGVARGWRSALLGAAAAMLLIAVVAVFGVAILQIVPINVLRVGLGLFLVLFGLKWLKKAIQRQAGLKPRHDERAAYGRAVSVLGTRTSAQRGLDPEAFATAFNGTLLEGLEVAPIIVAVGRTGGHLASAASGAIAAVVIVGVAGLLLRSPLTRVPENLLKFVVGLMLTTFGTFWAGEGVGVLWPGRDLSAVALLVCSCSPHWSR